jgi:UDP:flavonoid glycosyltransferase YjiC (YdhE family)
MRITVFAAGSRGDIQPCVALGRGLQQAGHAVHLAAPADFAGFVGEHGVGFRPLRGDVQAIMASETGRAFMEKGGGHPLASIRAVRRMIAPVVGTMADDAFAACEDAEALVCLGVFSAFGQSIAAALGIPLIHLEPTPLLPTRAFPAPSWPIQRDLGGLHNWLSGRAMVHVIWLWYRPFVRAFRQRLGLPRMTARSFYRGLRETPMVSAYSPTVIPHPPDWPDHVHVTGYFFLDAAAGPTEDWTPPADLAAFLDAGDPPVYIGFGSMAGEDPGALATVVVDALAASGRRGLVLTGWGGLRPELLPERVFVTDAVPHSWLFPRMAAVVHHGGAGTTAEGLRAGRPTVIVPFVLDQPFWGARVQALGVGPAPIPRKRLTAARLAAAITAAVTDAGMRERAASVGAAIRAEQGVAAAVEIVEKEFAG